MLCGNNERVDYMNCTIELKSKYKLLCIDQYGSLFYRSGRIFWEEKGSKAEVVYDIRKKSVKYRLLNIRPIERLLRLEPRLAVPSGNKQYLVTWNGKLLLIDMTKHQVKSAFVYRSGMKNPLRITPVIESKNFEKGLLFGEYWGNLGKEEVNIYNYSNGTVEKKYTFAPGTIQHVHSITFDSQRDRVLICTGDTDEESAIWETYDDFKNVVPIVRGAQCYRSCDAYPVEGGILYATDTPLRDNGIYYYDEKKGQSQLIYEMPGPCIYSIRKKNTDGNANYVFATSVEPDSSLPTWRYCITNKLGNGVKSRHVCIIAGNKETGFKKICSLKKDIWPMWLFQFGNVSFPYQENVDELLFTPVSVKKYDGCTLAVKL